MGNRRKKVAEGTVVGDGMAGRRLHILPILSHHIGHCQKLIVPRRWGDRARDGELEVELRFRKPSLKAKHDAEIADGLRIVRVRLNGAPRILDRLLEIPE